MTFYDDALTCNDGKPEIDVIPESDKTRALREKLYTVLLDIEIEQMGMTKDPLMIRPDWARSQHYVVGMQFVHKGWGCENWTDAFSSVARALNTLQSREYLYGFCHDLPTTWELAKLPPEKVYVVNPTVHGLMQIFTKLWGPDSCIFLEDLSFIMIVTHEDYCIYCGSRKLVEVCLGRTVEQAYAEFCEYVSGSIYESLLSYANISRLSWDI